MVAREQVLLDAALFDHIVSFQAGIPGRFYAYWKRNRLIWLNSHSSDDEAHKKTLPETGELVALAIYNGDVSMLAALHALFLSSPYYRSMRVLDFHDAIYLAAESDQVAVLQWLHDGDRVGAEDHDNAGHAAALCGSHNTLQWLLMHCELCANGVDVTTAKTAAERGHLSVITCLFDLRPELFVTSAVITSAVEWGHLDVVQFLHENLSPNAQNRHCRGLLDKAAIAGRLNVLEYLHKSCSEGCTKDAMDQAAAHGHLSTVKFLHEQRNEGCTVYALDQAAANGHLDVVKFLHEHRREGATIYAMSAASRRGYLEVVEFLHVNRTEGCSSWALAEAAEKGHLDVVKFLHSHRQGIDWEDSALFRAARNGHLEVVEFLCDNTKVGDRVFDARRGAKIFERTEVVKYLDVQIKKLLEQKEMEQREKLRRRKHAKAKKKRK